MPRKRRYQFNIAKAQRVYCRLCRKMREDAGYYPFGYNWSSLYATRPALAKAMSKTIAIRIRLSYPQNNA